MGEPAPEPGAIRRGARLAVTICALVLLVAVVGLWFGVALSEWAADTSGGGLSSTERWEHRFILLGGALPALLGAIAAVSVWIGARYAQKLALGLIATAFGLVLGFGPLTWGLIDGRTMDDLWFGNGGWPGPLWVVPLCLVVIGGAAWVRRDALPDDHGTPGVREVARGVRERLHEPIEVEVPSSSTLADLREGLQRHPERTLAGLLALLTVIGIGSGLASVAMASSAGTIEDVALSRGGTAWWAVSLLPAGLGWRRLVSGHERAWLYLAVAAVGLNGGAFMHWASWRPGTVGAALAALG